MFKGFLALHMIPRPGCAVSVFERGFQSQLGTVNGVEAALVLTLIIPYTICYTLYTIFHILSIMYYMGGSKTGAPYIHPNTI